MPSSDKIRKAKRQSWSKNCQGIDQIPTGARLTNVLKLGVRNKIGTTKQADGSFTMTWKETLNVLLDTRFHDSKEVDNCPEEWGQSELEPYRVRKENWNLLQRTVNRTKLTLAINSFDPYKSAGPDLITPAFLQQRIDALSSLLCSIFRACLALGYIPTACRKARVTLIPKPGKPTWCVGKKSSTH